MMSRRISELRPVPAFAGLTNAFPIKCYVYAAARIHQGDERIQRGSVYGGWLRRASYSRMSSISATTRQKLKCENENKEAYAIQLTSPLCTRA